MNRKTGGAVSRYLTLAATALIMLAAACSSGPSAEELSALEEQKQAALAAEKKVEELKKERLSLIETLSAKRVELKQVRADRSSVDKKLKEMEQAAPDTTNGKDED